MTSMKYSNQTITFAKHLVDHYAKFGKFSDSYQLSIDDFPDFEAHTLSSLIMADDEDSSSESTGPDNPLYDKKMLPALFQFLKDTTNKDNEIEFVNEWRDGVSSYFAKRMQELIDDLCHDKTHDKYSEAGFHANKHPDNGEVYWSAEL